MNNFQLSYSSANLLRGCESRFTFYKTGVENDPDYEDDTTAFIIGKSFHHILEMTKHNKPEKIAPLFDECIAKFNLDPADVPVLHAMILRYLRLHKSSGLECIACEIALESPDFIGYVDAILVDLDMNWWICDLKTAKTVGGDLASRVNKDVQLNLYSYFFVQIAEKLGLDPRRFKGCKYRVTTKSVVKQKASEDYTSYVTRLVENVKSYDYTIPHTKLDPKSTYADHLRLHDRALLLLNGKLPPSKNYSYCNNYFKACPYWSKCYGETFTELKKCVEVLSSEGDN